MTANWSAWYERQQFFLHMPSVLKYLIHPSSQLPLIFLPNPVAVAETQCVSIYPGSRARFYTFTSVISYTGTSLHIKGISFSHQFEKYLAYTSKNESVLISSVSSRLTSSHRVLFIIKVDSSTKF